MIEQEAKPIVEMTTCPECGTPVGADRLEKHRKRVHRGRESLPKYHVRGDTEVESYVSKLKPTLNPVRSPISIKCPLCQEFILLSELQNHISACSEKIKDASPAVSTRIGVNISQIRAYSKRKTTAIKKDVPKPPGGHRAFIIDEFGVFQSYSSWWENQNLAENTVDARPAQAQESKAAVVKSPTYSASLYTNCPECNVRLRKKNLEKHLRKVHKS
jgi:endogenous inhibitor of DNA gyrase (YacG/DUF329 family)